MSVLQTIFRERSFEHQAPPPEGLNVRGNVVCSQVRAEQFGRMQQIYGGTGGLITCDLFMRLLCSDASQPISTLAKLIVGRTLVNVQWNGQTLIPMFQVGCGGLVMKPYMPETLFELVDVFDDWEIACWFSQPSTWLSGRPPAVAITNDPEGVFLAARADRFIAKG